MTDYFILSSLVLNLKIFINISIHLWQDSVVLLITVDKELFLLLLF